MTTYLPTVFGENLFDMFDDFDRNFFRGFDHIDHALYGKHARNMMKTDVSETNEGYRISMDLPGFRKEDLHAELNNGYLTITAEKTVNEPDKTEEGRVLRRERYCGTMQRSFYVGNQITEEDIRASYENGVLELFIRKTQQPEIPEKKTIMIAG